MNKGRSEDAADSLDMRFGRPRTVGLRCGHCGSPVLTHTGWGICCLACWRWCTWTGPHRLWGDDNPPPEAGGQG